jgi:hypothetical protein
MNSVRLKRGVRDHESTNRVDRAALRCCAGTPRTAGTAASAFTTTATGRSTGRSVQAVATLSTCTTRPTVAAGTADGLIRLQGVIDEVEGCRGARHLNGATLTVHAIAAFAAGGAGISISAIRIGARAVRAVHSRSGSGPDRSTCSGGHAVLDRESVNGHRATLYDEQARLALTVKRHRVAASLEVDRSGGVDSYGFVEFNIAT